MTIKAIAMKDGYSNSAIAEAAYEIIDVTGLTKYIKVTKLEDLTNGDYLIVCEGKNEAYDGSITALSDNPNAFSVNPKDGVIYTAAGKHFTHKKDSNGDHTFKSASGYYIGKKGTSNGVDLSTEISYPNTVSFDANGNATITGEGGLKLLHNTTNSLFRYYSSGMAIQLYKKDSNEPVITVEPEDGLIINDNDGDHKTGTLTATVEPAGEITAETTSGWIANVNGNSVTYDGKALHAEGTVTYKSNGAADVEADLEYNYTGPLYILGTVNNGGWAPNNYVAMTRGADGLYTAEVTASEISFTKRFAEYSDQASWDYIYNYRFVPVSNGQWGLTENTIGKFCDLDFDPSHVDGQKIVMDYGTYTVTINPATNQFKIERYMETVATPEFSVEAGTYTENQTVKITCNTGGATIYYTTDGSDPDNTSTVYTGPITVDQTMTLKAIAMMDGWNNSAIASATYTINKPKIYNKVTHESQLIAGKKYILVYEDTPAFLGGISTTSTNYGIPVTGPTLEDNSVNIGQYSDIRELTLSGSSGEWLFHNGDGYLTWTGGNSLTVVSTPTTDSNQSKWTVSSTKNGYVLKSAVNNDRVLQYNSNDPRFACYTSAMKPVVLYVEDGVEPKPYVMADPTSLDFEAVIGQDPVTETFTVMAENLKGDITLTMSESDVFTITPATIPKADMTEEGVVVTVTYNPTAVTGEDFDKATVTIKSTDADDVKVNLTGMATLPDPELTVSPETLEMGTEPTRTFTVTGQHLTENVTLTVTEGEAKNFEISHATITPDEEGKVSQEVTVTYKGNSTEDEYATITVKSGIAKKEVIVTARVLPTPEIIAEPENLTMTAVVGQTPATATFTVMASDLRGDITLTMSESDVFTIEPATIRKADMTEDGVEVTVTYTPIKAGDDNATITIASEAAESATVTLNGTATVPEVVAMPTFSLVAGSYTGVQTVIISCATEGATISYSTDGGQTWTEGNTVNVDKDMTIMAKASRAGYTISETATGYYVIDIPEALPTDMPTFDGYYSVLNSGKYANIQGRKTLTFTDAPDAQAGTVIRLKSDNTGKVEVLRSQAADLQRYAYRAMDYVPDIVQIVVDKLGAEGEGHILGKDGLDAIMTKFDESFKPDLYIEKAGDNGYRIYGRTPSMQPVVDFYRENKDKVEAKLPDLVAFINSALAKLRNKANQAGMDGDNVFVDFDLKTIWTRMGGNLTDPEVDEMGFYRDVLNYKDNVWNFAYQTATFYLEKIKNTGTYTSLSEQLGEFAQYLDKIDQIHPDFKYYIVANEEVTKPDFISQGNADIINNAARTIWTLEPRTDFTVNFPANAETTCDKFQKATTLYTDFAYELPEGVTAYKVTDVVEGTAITEALSGVIPAQTPVLLMAAEAGDKVLTLSTEAGTAVTDNLLVGPDYLINTYKLTTPQVEGIFNMIKEKLGEDFYNTYVKEYEHLMYLNSGTVNNKYFWGLKEEDVKKCTYLDEEDVKDYVVRGLEGNAFVNNKQVKTNKAFLVSEDAQIISLNKRGDVNHDGKVNIKDVTDLIDRLLDPENTVACPICSDFNLSGKVDIKDVTDLIDVLLTAPYAEQEQPSTGSQD